MTTDDRLPVTQADRDAAAEALGYSHWAEAMSYGLSGEAMQMAELFARHRLAHSAPVGREPSGELRICEDCNGKGRVERYAGGTKHVDRYVSVPCQLCGGKGERTVIATTQPSFPDALVAEKAPAADVAGEARELLAQICEAGGDKTAAFTLRSVGAVGTVLSAQVAVLQAALTRPSAPPASGEVERLREALERIAAWSGEEALPDAWQERLAWIESELEDEPNRPLYALDSEQPLCRNGNELAELLLECIGLTARAALQPASDKGGAGE